ncbi:hypothetical protein L1S32_10635 [Methanogenium sp. S4BF]|uniref:tetratricopeptide repeat protein n=1 Tax=Methanogenium sp. S4BF TaxID=1789226 RepID=UPI002417BEAD|nr:hypothetical protein [Methanogenium sp. S4BF]WFN34288.1 hypothetical protein L1S32_10635 [Methanogenium sp. S4BF]
MLKMAGVFSLIFLFCLSVGCIADTKNPDGMPTQEFMGKVNESQEYYDALVATDPENPGAWCYRAMSSNNCGQYAAAMESCEKALELNPDYGLAWLVKGIVLMNMNRHCESLPCFANASMYDPELASYADIWYVYNENACPA